MDNQKGMSEAQPDFEQASKPKYKEFDKLVKIHGNLLIFFLEGHKQKINFVTEHFDVQIVS